MSERKEMVPPKAIAADGRIWVGWVEVDGAWHAAVRGVSAIQCDRAIRTSRKGCRYRVMPMGISPESRGADHYPVKHC